MECNIRSMSLADLPEVLEMEQELFSVPWSRQAFEEEINRHESFSLLVDEKLVGYICGWKILDEYNITNLAIRENLQQLGFGSRLLEHVFALHAEDCSMFYIEVRNSNIKARRFYKKKGFKEIGLRKNYYHDPVEDAFLMEIRI